MPPTVPINYYFGSRNQQNRNSLMPLFHAYLFKHKPALNTNFFKVIVANPTYIQLRAHVVLAKKNSVASNITIIIIINKIYIVPFPFSPKVLYNSKKEIENQKMIIIIIKK